MEEVPEILAWNTRTTMAVNEMKRAYTVRNTSAGINQTNMYMNRQNTSLLFQREAKTLAFSYPATRRKQSNVRKQLLGHTDVNRYSGTHRHQYNQLYGHVETGISLLCCWHIDSSLLLDRRQKTAYCCISHSGCSGMKLLIQILS